MAESIPKWHLCIAISISILSTCHAGLTLTGVQCGTKLCALGEYCSPFNRLCLPCGGICDVTGHNFDKDLCVKDCQVYIHDLRYVLRNEPRKPDEEDLKVIVKKLQYEQCVTVILLSIVLFFVVLFFGVKAYQWVRKNDSLTMKWIRKKLHSAKESKPPQNPNEFTHQNPHTESPKPQRGELRLQMPPPTSYSSVSKGPAPSSVAPSMGLPTPNTVSTPLSRRHPAEDTTLDYAYDNQGMNFTPSPGNEAFKTTQNQAQSTPKQESNL